MNLNKYNEWLEAVYKHADVLKTHNITVNQYNNHIYIRVSHMNRFCEVHKSFNNNVTFEGSDEVITFVKNLLLSIAPVTMQFALAELLSN